MCEPADGVVGGEGSFVQNSKVRDRKVGNIVFLHNTAITKAEGNQMVERLIFLQLDESAVPGLSLRVLEGAVDTAKLAVIQTTLVNTWIEKVAKATPQVAAPLVSSRRRWPSENSSRRMPFAGSFGRSHSRTRCES